MNQSQIIQSQNLPSEIKPRLQALMQALLIDNDLIGETIERSNFKSHFKPVIASLSKNLPAILMQMLDNVSEEDLQKGLQQVRDEFLPFLLGTELHCTCMTYDIRGRQHALDCPMYSDPEQEQK